MLIYSSQKQSTKIVNQFINFAECSPSSALGIKQPLIHYRLFSIQGVYIEGYFAIKESMIR